jgi:hypothetical protein
MILVAITLMCTSAQAEHVPVKNSVAGLKYTVVTESENKRNVNIHGFSATGFFVEKNLIATAKHFLKGKKVNRISVQVGHRMYYGKVVYQSKTHDLMFIKTIHREVPIPLCETVSLNEQYLLFSGAAQPVYTRAGNVTNTTKSKFYGEVQVVASDSGAPAVSFKNKCVMGIAVERFHNTGVSGYVNANTIKKALHEYHQ